jgi:hypothetical protein
MVVVIVILKFLLPLWEKVAEGRMRGASMMGLDLPGCSSKLAASTSM